MMTTRRFTRAVTAACVFLMAAAGPLMGQTYPLTFADGGIVPTGFYVPGELGTINPSGGNLTLPVPITSLPTGRAGMGLDLQLVYNSQMAWRIRDEPATFHYQPEEGSGIGGVLKPGEYGAWRYNVEYVLDLEERYYALPCPSETAIYQFRLLSPDGSFHVLHLSGGYADGDGYGYYIYAPDGKSSYCSSSSAVTGNLTYFTTDGSFIKVVLEDVAGTGESWEVRPWTIYFPDGRRIEGVGQATEAIYDRNNNKIEVLHYISEGNEVTKYSQVLDTGVTRDIEITHMVDGNDMPLTDEVRQSLFDNEELLWTVSWGAALIGSTNDPVYLCVDEEKHCHLTTEQALPVVTEVELPDVAGERTWTFDYWDNSTTPKGWGQITTAEAPSGAVAEYEYKYNQANVGSVKASDILSNPVVSKDLTHDGDTDTWTYVYDEPSNSIDTTTITAPDGGVTKFYSNAVADYELTTWDTGLVYKIEKPNGEVIENTWATNRPYEMTHTNDRGNAFVQLEVRSLSSPPNTVSLSASKTFDYDKNGNLKWMTEYDWDSTAVRSTVLTYYNPTAGSSSTSQESTGYWNAASSLGVRNALDRQEVRAGSIAGTLKAATEITYDDEDTTANPTATWSWDSTKGGGSGTLGAGNSVGTFATYDSYGNVETQTDGEGNVTNYTYGLICPDCNSSLVDLYPTKIETAYNTTVERTTEIVYDEYSGQLVISNDDDNDVATQFDYTKDGRIIEVLDGGSWDGEDYTSPLRKTTHAYDDVDREIRTERSLSTLTDGNLQTVRHFDELGRVRLVRSSDGSALSPSSETDGIQVKSAYATVTGGACQVVSNPDRTSGTDGTEGWTRTKFDTSGRVTEVATFSGSSQPSCTTTTDRTGYTDTSYDTASNGQIVTTIEHASDGDKKRTSALDALGRLTRVTEDPDVLAYVTNYAYDALDNLTAVDQGSVDRSFSYDSLSRLSSATNPESGTTSYTYDRNGQLKTRTDSLGIVTTNTYDELGRLTGRSYNTGPTLPATFVYGTTSAAQPNRGQLIEVRTASVASKRYSYDELGRITASTQITDGQPYVFGYEYNLNDSVTSMTYPTGGKEVVYSYQAFSGRLVEAGRTGDTDYYLDAATYAPHGAPTSMTLGNGVAETTDYNSRLQPVEIQAGSLLTLGFNYNSTNNNGNLASQTITAPSMGSVTQYYKYDQLNRLSIASEGAAPVGSAPSFSCSGSAAWCRTYGYDRYGNRAVTSAVNHTLSFATPTAITDYNTTNNRLKSSSPAWADYDNAGNITAFTKTGVQWSAAYDAENKQTFFCGGTTATCNSGNADAQYIYDGEGNRVQKLTSGVTTLYVYDAFGRLAAEYTTATPTVTAGSYWRTTDHLGSTRLVTTSAGAAYDRRDLFPFGEQIADTFSSRSSAGNYNGTNPASRHLFTAKERDAESGLDYFLARYYSGSLGRFTSPDAPFVDQFPIEPQSWNLFGYVRNNPLRFFDPTGRECVTFDDGSQGDDGAGEACAGAQLGTAQEVEVTANPDSVFGPPSPLLLAVAQGAQRAEPVVDGLAVATGVLVGGGTAAIAGSSSGLVTMGILAEETALMAALNAAASAPGTTVVVVTALTNAPQAGRALSVATGPGAQGMMRALRASEPARQVYSARISAEFISLAEKAGLARTSVTNMGGGAQATEIRFSAKVTEFITGLFK